MATWMTTALAVAVNDVQEADVALAAGAKALAAPYGVDAARALAERFTNVAVIAHAHDEGEARALAEAGVAWIITDAGAASAPHKTAQGGGVARIAAAAAEDAAMWTALHARGFAGATPQPGPSGRLTDAWSMAALSAFATHCRAQGLAFGFGGGLEAPDAPRLLAFKPRWILFDEAVREGGALSRARLKEAAALFRDAGAAAATRKTLERVFLRDLVVDMSIGVYDRERRRKQPARFTVEVDLAPAAAEVSFADVFTYDVIIDHIRALAAHGHHNLVETLADDVAQAALGHPRARAVRVVVEKLAVIEGSVGVEVRREKD